MQTDKFIISKPLVQIIFPGPLQHLLAELAKRQLKYGAGVCEVRRSVYGLSSDLRLHQGGTGRGARGLAPFLSHLRADVAGVAHAWVPQDTVIWDACPRDMG